MRWGDYRGGNMRVGYCKGKGMVNLRRGGGGVE